MKVCPRCGFANLDENERCLKCQARLGHSEALVDRAPRRRRVDTTGLSRVGRRLWGGLIESVWPTLPEGLPHRRPATAAALALVPGAGQLYNGQPLKAVYFLVAWAALLALAAATFFRASSYLTLAAWLAVWTWMANDGLVTAIRINGQTWTSRQSWASWLAIITLLAVVWFVALTAASPFVYFRLIGQTGFEPLFNRGDFVWLDKWCLMFGGAPRRGEYIYYDPAGFTMHRGRDTFFYDAQSFIGRVVGLPGEHVVVQRRDGDIEITVDGRPLPRDLHPPITEHLPAHREFDVPEGHWLILQTHTLTDGFAQAFTGATPAPSLSGHDLDPAKSWTNSNYVPRERMIGRIFAISHPPERRRWFPRGEPEP